MTEPTSTTSLTSMSPARTGSSRKLLARKALTTLPNHLSGDEALEASFPAAVGTVNAALSATDAHDPTEQLSCDTATASTVTSVGEVLNKLIGTAVDGPPAFTGAATPPVPVPPPAWSAEDESALQTLLARRKAAGYQRRGRDVGGQLIAAGSIKPNPDTVVAVIVSLVAERGRIERAALIDAMERATFPHAKAQPTDRGWCQGYVAGALRNGYLAVAEQPVAAEAA